MWMLQIVLSSDSPCGNKDNNYESNYPKTPNGEVLQFLLLCSFNSCDRVYELTEPNNEN